ncbi:MAG: uroporphyrinogen-III synthase, partial [Pseudomonadota bacterium]|nr:uroporphyrinogen-III synthase [Pseudomonadota bacterium]
IAPLFTIQPLRWETPGLAAVDALLVTSANAVRHGGQELARFTSLPCFAVGEASAAAALQAGFSRVAAGGADGAAALRMAMRSGMRRILHVCGRDHVRIEHPGVSVIRRIVYAAEAVDQLPQEAAEASRSGAVALVHSARAASHFALLLAQSGLDRSRVSVAAISPAAAAAAGTGWKQVASAADPRDEGLLELAAKLCQTARGETGNGDG